MFASRVPEIISEGQCTDFLIMSLVLKEGHNQSRRRTSVISEGMIMIPKAIECATYCDQDVEVVCFLPSALMAPAALKD